MDINYTAEEQAFRREVRQFIDANYPADIREKTKSGKRPERDDLLRWHQILNKKGWVAPEWPVQFGGTGWNAVQRHIFDEECADAGTN